MMSIRLLCFPAMTLSVPFFSTGDGRTPANGDRVEYEYEFSDGKRKAPRVILVGPAAAAGAVGAGTGSPPPFTRGHDVRGVCFVACTRLPFLSYCFPLCSSLLFSSLALHFAWSDFLQWLLPLLS
mmetsp:Transcript_53553/g.138435  ORF Transcript_53553/g.138435 Transcript_53553/m.138435 type:complete len:125 (+) Transcript_53553:220-594(+)